jgi:hypothetical protein
MKIQELLQEAPLPDDWDKSAYKSNTSFASRLRYAQERAKKIGTGSSRVAFEIEHEGRPTILKIAKNKKGLAQNDYESQMFNDYYATGLGIFIPAIDHDEENEPPTWIHTEKAEKIKPNQFKQFFNGLTPDEVFDVVLYGCGQRRKDPETSERYQEIIENNEYIDSLVDLIGNYGLPWQDFTRLANWGVYKNEPVIIDIGLSSEVLDLHYS